MLKTITSTLCFLIFSNLIFSQSFDNKLFAELKYRYIGVDGNRAIAVVGESGNSMVSYVGAASGGIWKTAASAICSSLHARRSRL